MAKHDLELDETICRYLFSSPAHFPGQCSGEDFFLTPAFPSWGHREASHKHYDGSNFVLSVRTEPGSKESIRIETYEWVGDHVSALLAHSTASLFTTLATSNAATSRRSQPRLPGRFATRRDRHLAGTRDDLTGQK